MEAVLFVLFPENNIFSNFWFDKNLEEEEKKKKKQKKYYPKNSNSQQIKTNEVFER